MAINKKLIHFKTKENFMSANGVNGDPITPSSGSETEGNAEYGQIKGTSVAFIKDTKEIWTHGQLYNCSKINILETVYPIGAIYLSTISIDPANLFGFGEWEQIKDVFLLAGGEKYTAGSKGGSETTTLTEANLPPQNGKITMHGGDQATNILSAEGVFREWNVQEGRYRDAGVNIDHPTQSVGVIYYTNNGQNTPINNMPPYLAVYMYKRIA